MLPPPLPDQIRVLAEVLNYVEELADGAQRPVVVFELDRTLFDTRTRTLNILWEYAEQRRAQEPQLSSALEQAELGSIQPMIGDTLRALGETRPTLLSDVGRFWRERYFHDDYLVYDTPAAGAADFVRDIHGIGAHVMVVTHRDLLGMYLGTCRALRDHGFWLGEPGFELIMKPDFELSDEAFKRTVFPKVNRVGPVAAVFDGVSIGCAIAQELSSTSEFGVPYVVEVQLPAGDALDSQQIGLRAQLIADQGDWEIIQDFRRS